MVDLILIAVLLLIVGGAFFYLVRAKRRGVKCVGCPYASACGGKCRKNNSSRVQGKSSDQKEDGRK